MWPGKTFLCEVNTKIIPLYILDNCLTQPSDAQAPVAFAATLEIRSTAANRIHLPYLHHMDRPRVDPRPSSLMTRYNFWSLVRKQRHEYYREVMLTLL
jgi:hypothetical protein